MYANFEFRSHGQICIYATFAYMQIEICTWFQPGANFKNLHICKFCIRVQIHSHGHICTREYICIYANIFTRMQICPCERTYSYIRFVKKKKKKKSFNHAQCNFTGERICWVKREHTSKWHYVDKSSIFNIQINWLLPFFVSFRFFKVFL